MIGIYDCDLFNYKSLYHLPIPNLEVMKISSYYVVEERQYCRLLLPGEQDIDAYDMLYCCAEHTDIFPSHFMQARKLELVGAGFNNGQYKPFSNSLIDFTLPRTTVYKEFLRDKFDVGYEVRDITRFLDSTYYRIMAGDEILPIPAVRHRTPFYIYDTNIFVHVWEKIIKEIKRRYPSKIVCLHPIWCDDIELYFSAIKYGISPTSEFILNLGLDLELANSYFKQYTNKMLASILLTSAIYLPLGGTHRTIEEYVNDFVYTLNLLFTFWAHEIPVKIKYLPPAMGAKNPIDLLCKKAENVFSLTTSIKRASSLAEQLPKGKTGKEIREQYDLLCRYCPQANNLFNQSYKGLVERKIWRPV